MLTLMREFFICQCITDPGFHKIVGWCLAETLEAKYPIQTLEQGSRGLRTQRYGSLEP